VFQAPSSAGVATIKATMTSLPQVSLTTQVTMPQLGSIQLAAGGVQNPVMGVKYSGWNEQNVVTIALLDTTQQTYPDGLAVRFEHQRFGGSTISTPWAADTATCKQASGCIGYLAQTDATGQATVNVYSGTAAGLVLLTATATAGGSTIVFPVSNIAIVGAKASGAHVSLECSPKNIPVLAFERDCFASFYAGDESPITCVARFADRFNNVLGREVLATFLSEAGAAGPPVFTGAYDPKTGGDQTATMGFATDTIAITGYALPADVDPVFGEPSFPIPLDPWCEGPRTANPRDGLSTVIVMARGEEGFVDLNGNGVWDPGEPFIDMGEPFVDLNDDGIYEPGEPFFDANGNGQWDGPNGQWDSDTVIWSETRVLYTGAPENAVAAPDPVNVNSSIPGPVTTELVSFFVQDVNLNPITPFATYTVSTEKGGIVSTMLTLAPGTVDNLGMGFTLAYCDQPPGTAPTKCANICPSSPCYVVPRVFDFGQSTFGKIAVTGAAPGTETVDVSTTFDNVTLPDFLSFTAICH